MELWTRMQECMDEAVQKQEMTGVNLLIARGGEVLAELQSGLADRERGIPMARDTIFRMYSMTKPITACAAMILMERGELDFYDWVENYIPSFHGQKVVTGAGMESACRGVSLRDLLTMSSGLAYPDADEAGQAVARVYEEAISRLDGEAEMSTLEFAEKIGNTPLSFQPGRAFRYGTSADVLGAVVEVVSGKRLGDFLRDEIFKPLGMHDTAFYVPRGKQHRRAMTYRRMPDGTLARDPSTNLAISDTLTRDPLFQSGGAGLCSTLPDYARFAAMLLRGGELDGVRILRPKTVEFFTRARLDEGPQRSLEAGWPTLSGFSYGNLLRVCRDPGRNGSVCTPGEYGWDGWLGTCFSNHPAEGITVLMGMQTCDSGNTNLNRRLHNLLFTSL